MIDGPERVTISTAHTRLWMAQRTLKRLIDNGKPVEPVELSSVLEDLTAGMAKLEELNDRPPTVTGGG